MDASSTEQTTIFTTLHAGATSAAWSIRTKQITFDTMPDAFHFDPIDDADLGTYYFSNTVTIGGLEIPVSISLTGVGVIFKN